LVGRLYTVRMTKVCARCGKKKPLKEFAVNRSKPDGLNWQCRKCQAVYHKAHYEAHKARYIQNAREYKDQVRAFVDTKKLKCSVRSCSERHVAALEFHHKDPKQKELAVSIMITNGWSMKKLKDEIKKCRVLCANCHRKLHWRLRRHH
jgi:hypothetical protein